MKIAYTAYAGLVYWRIRKALPVGLHGHHGFFLSKVPTDTE